MTIKADPLAANYGEIPFNAEISGKEWTKVQELTDEKKDQTVLIRGYAQKTLAFGKNKAFVLVREGGSTVHCVLTVAPDLVSQQMVKFAASLSQGSIVEITGVVSVLSRPITGATQQVQIEVRKVHCVKRANSARSEVEIEKALEAGEQLVCVNKDTRLDFRVLDLHTPANKGIFRNKSQVENLHDFPSTVREVDPLQHHEGKEFGTTATLLLFGREVVSAVVDGRTCVCERVNEQFFVRIKQEDKIKYDLINENCIGVFYGKVVEGEKLLSLVKKTYEEEKNMSRAAIIVRENFSMELANMEAGVCVAGFENGQTLVECFGLPFKRYGFRVRDSHVLVLFGGQGGDIAMQNFRAQTFFDTTTISDIINAQERCVSVVTLFSPFTGGLISSIRSEKGKVIEREKRHAMNHFVENFDLMGFYFRNGVFIYSEGIDPTKSLVEIGFVLTFNTALEELGKEKPKYFNLLASKNDSAIHFVYWNPEKVSKKSMRPSRADLECALDKCSELLVNWKIVKEKEKKDLEAWAHFPDDKNGFIFFLDNYKLF